MLRRLFTGHQRSASAAEALIGRGSALHQAGDLAAAEACLREAIAAAPDSGPAHVQLGVVVATLGRLDDAAALFARAVALDPDDPYAHMNLANVHRRLAQPDAALEHYRAAVRLKPDLPVAWSNMLRPLLDACDWAGAARALDSLLERRHQGAADWARYIAPMDSILAPVPSEACREIAEFHAGRLDPAAPVLWRRRTASRERLRIGYLSRDFRNHAVGQLARAFLRAHDRSQVEVLAYSYGRDDDSRYRHEVAAAADRFIDVRDEHPDATARRIADDEIDILVDLGGYTTDHRLAVLARRPAPVQVHYLGYPATLGAPFVDYFITDHVASPPGQDALFTEHLVRMPACFMVSDPDQPLATTAPSRAALGLPAGGVIFCAFHQTAKITAGVFAAWAEILRVVPGSVLWLRAVSDPARRNLTAAALASDVAPERLVFAPNLVDKRAHVSRMLAADLFLDTFDRYNGHSTVNEALWAGLPVVTIAGETFAARVAASLAAAAGVPELAAADRARYVATAVRLAGDPAARGALQRKLIAARVTAPLFDNERLVRALERAYREMWSLHAAGERPRAFSVSD